jgi:exopolysaccharide production protein ExoQ
MPPVLALAVVLVFVVAFFTAFSKDRAAVSKWSYVPLIWMLIIGSRPISSWIFDADVTAGDYLEGSPFDRLIFLLLIAAGVIGLSTRPIDYGAIFRRNWLLAAFSGYLAISVFWSDYPFVSAKRWIKDFGNVVLASVVLTERDPVVAVRWILSRVAAVLVPASVLLIKYYPEIGRYYDRWTYKPYFAGVTTDKNLLGIGLFIFSVSLFWVLSELWRERVGRELLKRSALFVLLAATAWLLFKARSSTALACSVLGIALVWTLRFPKIAGFFKRMLPGLLGGTLMIWFLQSTFNLGEIIVTALGRDMTLTGRTDIWENLLKEPINPLFGVGFYSFWLGDRQERLSEKYYYHLNEAHNGYLETYLNSGLIGLALLVAMFVVALRRESFRTALGDRFAAFKLAILSATLLYAITEAIFNRMNVAWFAVLLALIDIPRKESEFTHVMRQPSAGSR